MIEFKNLTRCPRCKGKLTERKTDWAKFGLKEPSMHKRNKVMECCRCGELWYEGKPDVSNDWPVTGTK